MTTGFIYDDRYLSHDTGQGHPERADRLRSAIAKLRGESWYDSLTQYSPRVPERNWIEAIHQGSYINHAETEIKSGAPYLDSADVTVSEQSYDVALLATGAALELCDAVATNTVDNGFALIRPPGHHAEAAQALGFCVFNNIAIAARYLQRHHGLDKIAIVDWDVHHGNGTQHSFEDDPSVLFISTHQYPYYPGTGAWSETGTGPGQGATLNCPMNAGATDADYMTAFSEKVIPALHDFKPQMILLSAGFDAHRNDPLASVNLSTDIYGWMTQRILEVADQHCGGKVVSLLEGGYDLTALADCVSLHVSTLSGHSKSSATSATD